MDSDGKLDGDVHHRQTLIRPQRSLSMSKPDGKGQLVRYVVQRRMTLPSRYDSGDNSSASSTVPTPVLGTVQSRVAIYDTVRPGSSAALTHDSTNAISSKTGTYASTNLTVPTTFGNIDQEISKPYAGLEDGDQYSAAGSTAPYDDQYVDIITMSLLRDLDPEDLLAVEPTLPSLLKECAIRIGHEDHSAFHRQMMFFAHQNHG